MEYFTIARRLNKKIGVYKFFSSVYHYTYMRCLDGWSMQENCEEARDAFWMKIMLTKKK